MKNYSIIKMDSSWSTEQLRIDVERFVNRKSREGYEITTVAFGINLWWMPTAFITICK
ncbi:MULTISPECIES: hypothetical protein [Cellulophaga]|jgi:hypothetical protein|uniref:DUF4177 domain-containing protein n=1 Tax=Cellulophaga baltica TaxID=76594 RepID=A0A1G7ELF8_9FLAO|nr:MULTISPECIES: hypothetical protein [Cellulophaga]MCR1024381.1 hypothetical protein [Cellulophaga baltica]SDE64573.1 hypothetical protein SAMN04487992_102397 [Cellulophaga baltica]